MAMAPPPDTDPPPISIPSPTFSLQPYYMNGKIIVSALAILFFIVFLAALLHIYAKWSTRRRRRTTFWYFPGPFHVPPPPHHPLTRGLDKAVVESLPIFTFKQPPPSASRHSVSTTSLECAVCLSEFQEDEKCRLLPACNHSFHTECIDMWFLTNTTCPLCRTSAEPPPNEIHDAASVTTCLLPADNRPDDIGELGAGLTSGSDVEEMEDRRRNVYGVSSTESRFGDGGHLARHLSFGQSSSDEATSGARSWRRSISDRFPNISQNVQFPTNVLFWGNNSHMNSRMNPEHWLIGGRSLPHIVLDIGRTQEHLIQHHGSSPSDGPSRCSSLEHQNSPSSHVQRPFHRLKSLKRLLSREKKTLPLVDDGEENAAPLRG